jgi:hypothetical protein
VKYIVNSACEQCCLKQRVLCAIANCILYYIMYGLSLNFGLLYKIQITNFWISNLIKVLVQEEPLLDGLRR